MLKLRSSVLAMIALIVLCAAGYAYLNPAFASTCKSAYLESVTWVSHQADVAQGAFTRSRCYAACKAVLNKGSARNQRLVQSQAKPSPSAQPSFLSAGQKIANGHAFSKHAGRSGFSSKAQMADHINRVISSASPSDVKHLARGRKAYWDSGSGTVVIVDPNTADGGTSFKPGRGRKYFEGLK